MKTRMKRLISLLCVITVFASTVLSVNFLSAKADTNSGQVETWPTDLTEITFKDFELKKPGSSGPFTDGDYSKWTYGLYGGDTMDNTMFIGNITFPEVGGNAIQYGGVGGWNGGFEITVGQNNSDGYYLRLRDTVTPAAFSEIALTSSKAGTQVVGKKIQLGLSLEYVNRDNGTTNNDLKLGVWFNGKLYDNQYVYINNYVDAAKSIGKYLTVIPSGGAAIRLESFVRMPEDMTEINFTDFDIADGSYSNTFSGTYSGATMDKTLFSGKLTFSETGETHFMYGGTEAWGGFVLTNAYDTTNQEYYLRLYDSNKDNVSGKQFNDMKFYADKAGVESFVGKEFQLSYTIEYVNNDNGTTKNDLKLGVWFNKKLYDNQYIYINNYVDNGHSIGTVMTFWNRNGATIGLKSANYQLPEDMTNISFRDFGIADGEYTKWKGQTYSGETMDNTLFSGTITFPKVAGAQLSYAGKENYTGLELVVGQDTTTQEWYLRLRENKNKAFKEQSLYSDIAGVELVGVPLELHISLEYVNMDEGATSNDVKLGVWFGGKLYNDEYIYIKDFVDASNAIGNWLTYVPKTGGPIYIESSDIPMPKDMQNLSFRDFGFADGTISASITKGEYEGNTMNNTLFRGNITYSTVGTSHLAYGGKGSLQGFLLSNAKNATTGEDYLRLWDSNADKSGKKFNDINFYSDVAGVQLVGTKLDLAFTMEYVNNDNGQTANDLKLGVWFGGKLYNNTYIYINNYVDTGHSVGNFMTIWNQEQGATITVESVGAINWKPMPTDMKEITFRDFGFVDGDYTSYPNGQYEGDTLDGTLFRGNITFTEAGDNHMMYGGKVAGGGLELAVGNDATKGYHLRLRNPKGSESTATFSEIKFYSDVAGVTLVGEEFDLAITMEYIDRDGKGSKNDLKLGMWFGGKLYNNNYIYIDNYVDNSHSMGTWLAFAIFGGGTTTIESVGEINWKPMPTGLKEITFRDFGLIDGDYTKYPDGKYDGESLDGTLFSGKITFSKIGDTHMMYGGKVTGGGLELALGGNETEGFYLRLRNPKGSESTATFNEIKFYSDVAGVELVGTELELSLSLEYIDHDGKGSKNDVKLGVWFGGKLYNNNYIYLDNYVDNSHSMGTWLAFAIMGEAKTTIKSVGTINWKDVPEGLKEITFRDFGFIDGDISKYPSGEYEGKTLDNTIFTGKITFPKNVNAHIMYGGKVGGGGFDIVPAQDEKTGQWYLRLFDTNQDKTGRKFAEYKFYENVAGMPLVGTEVALSLSLQYVDHDKDGAKDDVKLGVWFGGKLYNNNYIYLDNFADTGHSMGTWMAFSVVKTTKIAIESVGEIVWKPLPNGFTVLGFADYGFKPGSYEGGIKSGQSDLESMDKTLFSGVVTYSKEGETHFTYGGKKGLSGIDLVNVKDAKTGEHYLRLFDTNADKKGKLFNDLYFYSDVAGVTLVGEELDLKISMEYVNHDGGKTNNDLKLGMWFGGRLYNNRYIYIDNYVDNSHSVGNYMTVWVRNGAVFNVGRISEWLNWSAFGLTGNWQKTLLDTDFNLEYALAGGNPYTGDQTQFPYLFMVVSLAVVILCGCQIVRRRRNEYDL